MNTGVYTYLKVNIAGIYCLAVKSNSIMLTSSVVK